MTITRKASSPDELLRLIPTMLGYIPQNSLVLLPMRGGRTVGAMRLDLPATAETAAETARTAAGLVAQVPDVNAVIACQYGEQNVTLQEWLVTSLETLGAPIIESLYVTDEGWGSYTSGVTGPLEDIAPENVPGLPLGTVDIEPIAACPPHLASCTPSDIDEEIFSVVTGLEDYLYRDSLHYVSLSVFMTILGRPALRDIFLIHVALGETAGDRALDAQLAFEDGVEYPTDLAMVMWGEGPRPDPDRLERALKICRAVLSVRPDAGAYSAAAWLSWALGRSTHAHQYAELGMALEAEHGMCEIVESFINAGHLPNWAFTR